MKISQEAFRKTTGQAGKAVATLRDKEGTVLFIREKSIENKEEQTLVFTGEQMPVKAWDNENPYLYSLEVCLYDAAGKMTEAVPYDVGFRSIRIENKIIRLNGKRLFIKGVNRHEWSPEGGRCITMEDMEWDIAFLKQNHINAVRTCHYPDRREWYSLCDRARDLSYGGKQSGKPWFLAEMWCGGAFLECTRSGTGVEGSRDRPGAYQF